MLGMTFLGKVFRSSPEVSSNFSKWQFIVDVPNPYSLFRIIKYFVTRNENLGDETHLIFWTPASLKSILANNGFEVEKLNTNLSNKFKFLPNFIIKGLGSHLLVSAKKLKTSFLCIHSLN